MTASPTSVAPGTEKWVLLATILASSMAFIDSTALDVAARTLQNDLNVSGSELLWIINAYTLFLSALILTGGSLGDIYGRKRVFMAGIGLFTVASLACGLAMNAGMLIAARAIQGVGGALMVPGSLSLLSALFPPEKRGQAIGTWSTFSTLTTLSGPLLGGWLASQDQWRIVFFINLPLAAIALAALALKVPESRDMSGNRRVDVPGAILITLALAGITYAFTEVSTYGLGDPRIFLTLGGGVLALILFIIVEARSDHPMVPLGLFRSRTFTGTNALTLFLYTALSAVPFFLILNLQRVQGYEEFQAGLAFLPFGILLTVMSRWAGGLVDRVGARLPLIVGPAIAGIGFFLFALPGVTSGANDYWLSYFPAVVVLGVGMGITVAPLTTAVMGSAPSEMVGTASGINNAVARTARVFAIAILGAVALLSFTGALGSKTSQLNLSEEAQVAVREEANKLADSAVPEIVPAEQAPLVEEAIRWSFVETFRLIAVISAVLAWLSALMAGLLVESQ
jgi:EmrB/QacA subfamily drug resistance transporter